jgi:hypothetical protein
VRCSSSPGTPTGRSSGFSSCTTTPKREVAYAEGAEKVLAQAGRDGWTVISMKDDGARAF